MRGSLAGFLLGVEVFGAATFAAGDLAACVIQPPPPSLVGMPAEDEMNVPTTVVPVYDIVPLITYIDASRLSLATFELVSTSGVTVPVVARMSYVWHFELVPETELEPRTTYSLRAFLPPAPGAPEPPAVGLSFTTGDGPLGEPDPPSARMQHWTTENLTSSNSCSPSENGSCIFFEPGTALDVAFVGSGGEHYLYFGSFITDLAGVDQGTPYTCAELRTRGLDGALSDPLTLCRDDGELYTVFNTPDGLECTDTGLTQNGVPLDGSGGSAGTGGSTGGSGAEEPDDPGSRTIVTEGCGCSVPGTARRSNVFGWIGFAIALSLLRRAAARRA